MDLCKKRRPIVDPIAPFILQLQQYERQCDVLGLIHRGKEQLQSNTDGQEPSNQGVKRKAIGPTMPARQCQEEGSSTIKDKQDAKRVK
jgi:hypothetical protein